MGQQLIKSSKEKRNFKLVSLTENRFINKKIFGLMPSRNSIDAFKKSNVIIFDTLDWTNALSFEGLYTILSRKKYRNASVSLLVKLQKWNIVLRLKIFVWKISIIFYKPRRNSFPNVSIFLRGKDKVNTKSKKYWDLIDEQLYRKHKDRLAKYFSFDN